MPVDVEKGAGVDGAHGAPKPQLLAAAAQPGAAAWQRAIGTFRRRLARAGDPLQRVALRCDLVEAYLRRAETIGRLSSASRLLALAADAVADARALSQPDILLRALDVSSAALQAFAPHRDDEHTAQLAAEWSDAAALLDPYADIARWAVVQRRLSAVLAGIYYRAGDNHALSLAIAGYHAARRATSPRRDASIWAWASLNLAMVLRDSAGGSHDLRGLRKTIAPARAALRVFTHDGDAAGAAAARHTWAVALTMIADIAYCRDLLDEADRLWAANEETWPRDTRPADWARMTNSRALAILTIGEMEGDPAALTRALRLLDELSEVWTKEHDPEHFAYAAINKSGARRRLAAITGNHRDLQIAVAELHQALTLFSSGRNLVLKGELLHVLGGAESELAHFLRDEPLAAAGERRQLAAMRIYEKAGIAVHDLALARNNLGAALLQAAALGRAGTRLARAERHLGAAVALYGPEASHSPAIRARRNLFAVRLEQATRAGDAPLLRALAAEIDQYTARSPNAVPWERAALLLLAANARAGVARLSGDVAELRELAALLRRLFDDPALPSAAMIAVGLDLGRVLAAMEQADRAIDIWTVTQDRLWQALLRADGAAERRSLGRMANARTTTPDAYAGRLGLGVALGDDLAMALLNRDAPGDRERAVIALSRSRGLLRAAVAAPDALNHLRGALRAANARLRNLDETVARRAALGPAQAEAVSRDIAAAVHTAEAAERTFRDAVVALGLSRAPAPDIAALAGAVPPEGALVVVAVGASTSAAIIIRAAIPAEIEVLPLPLLTRGKVEVLTAGNGGGQPRGWFPALRRFNDSIAGAGGARLPHWAIAAWDDAIRDVLAQLWARAMGPLDDRLRTLGLVPGSEVAICTPGLLASLPLHAAGSTGGGDSFLDHWAVRWVPDLHVERAPTPQPLSMAQPRLLALVDPLEDLLEPGMPDPIERFFPPEQTTLLRGRAATVAAVLEQLPHHDYVSFTCHGSYDPVDPEMSGLDLAAPRLGPDDRPVADRLSVAALRALTPVRRKLCMLAACETAIFDVSDVVDELEGLQTEFLDLGFAAVVGASWPVASAPTDSLIERFCGIYFDPAAERGPTPAAALRLAQLAMRSGPTSTSNPGTFRLIGGPAATPLTIDEPQLAPDAPFWWAGFRLLGGL